VTFRLRDVPLEFEYSSQENRIPPILVQDKLNGSCVLILDGLCDPYGRPADFLSELAGEDGRRRLLNHLLITALQRAIAFIEVKGAPRG